MSEPKWESRIVEFGEVAPDQLLANPLNARRHPGAQRDALRASLDEIGWVAPVIVNRRTGRMVDGHARVEEALSAGLATVPVVTIDVSEDEERVMLATFDPIGALATYDQELLAELLPSISDADGVLAGMLNDIAAMDALGSTDGMADSAEWYTRKVETPVYEPKGLRPDVSELAELDTYHRLLDGIAAAELSDDDRQFLQLAAARHVRFSYDRIAEFYAHAPEDVQRLMEDSALVIIDFDRAIELGYVKMHERFMAQFGQEEQDD